MGALSIERVAFVGASGNLGDAIVDFFLAQEKRPEITVLTRLDSKTEFPDGVNVVKTDYSPKSVEDALRNHQVAFSFLNHDCPVDQTMIFDAARKAGVRRFIPSEYGIRTYEPRIMADVSLARKKRSFIEHLMKTEQEMSWTAIINNIWLDFGLLDGLSGFDTTAHKATIYDGGDVPFSTATRTATCQTIYNLLADPALFEEAKNQYIHIAPHTTTQNEVLSILEKHTGQKWERENVKAVDVVPKAKEDIKNRDMWGLGQLVQSFTFGKYFGEDHLGDFRQLDTWDARLKLPKENLEDDIKSVLDGKYKVVHWPPPEIPDSLAKW